MCSGFHKHRFGTVRQYGPQNRCGRCHPESIAQLAEYRVPQGDPGAAQAIRNLGQHGQPAEAKRKARDPSPIDSAIRRATGYAGGEFKNCRCHHAAPERHDGQKSDEQRIEDDRTTDRYTSRRAVAERRGQTLAQLALVWTLRDPVVTSALIGASKPEQVTENVKALDNMKLTKEELDEIDAILANR